MKINIKLKENEDYCTSGELLANGFFKEFPSLLWLSFYDTLKNKNLLFLVCESSVCGSSVCGQYTVLRDVLGESLFLYDDINNKFFKASYIKKRDEDDCYEMDGRYIEQKTMIINFTENCTSYEDYTLKDIKAIYGLVNNELRRINKSVIPSYKYKLILRKIIPKIHHEYVNKQKDHMMEQVIESIWFNYQNFKGATNFIDGKNYFDNDKGDGGSSLGKTLK